MPATSERRRQPRLNTVGVVVRHQRGCGAGTSAGGPCSCEPGFQAQVWSARDRKTIRKTFRTLSEAHSWRQEAQVALRKGTLRAPSEITVEKAAADWPQFQGSRASDRPRSRSCVARGAREA